MAELITGKLAHSIKGGDAFDPQAAWLIMQRAVRNLGREGLAATAISAVDAAIYVESAAARTPAGCLAG
jgi:L-alanine-DL-glutamate epimerase-like enolase superfamily enzyme